MCERTPRLCDCHSALPALWATSVPPMMQPASSMWKYASPRVMPLENILNALQKPARIWKISQNGKILPLDLCDHL